MQFFRSVLSPITPILVAEMSQHHPTLQLIPTDAPPTDVWTDDILAGKFEILQRVKSSVNKSLRDSGGASDLKQIELVFDLAKLDREVAESFGVFRKNSEINEFFQSPAVHVLTNGSSSDFKDLKLVENSDLQFGLFKTDRQLCARCRLFLSHSNNALCPRCASVVVNQC